ncbi:hypothetical protein EBB79_19775 [Parasedimentitalea marina]|uniref:Uncharacterized protein n=2 Tax=Parasedimentitalea marina TaxID=2483033 RepID=A0A3T0N9B5_9RHOB|nr:hypothetical protein EBB79_19775 [Parasedimentitalea marina]
MRHVAVMSFTSSIGLMAIFAVDLIDMIFISMLGKDALAAAAGYASTLLFFTNSISMGLSIAAGALVSKALGRGKLTEAREFATSVAFFTAITGCVLPFFILLNLGALLGVLGASGVVAEQAKSYLWINMPTMSVIGVAMTGMAVLRAYGDARRSMYSTLLGGLANAVFDAIGITRQLIFLFCGPLALVSFFNGAIFAANATFNNLGHPLYSAWINWGKNTVGTLPFVLIGAAFWGAPGILVGQAVGVIIFSVIAITLAMRVVAAPSEKSVKRPFLKHHRNHILCSQGRW